MPSNKAAVIAQIDFLSSNYITQVTKLRDNLFIILERLAKDDDEYRLNKISKLEVTNDNSSNRSSTN